MKPYKAFKIILLLMIILSLIVTGCRTSENEADIEKPIINVSGYSTGIPIFLIMPEGSRPQDEEISKWENYILDKYELDINLKYTDYKFDSETVSKKIDEQFGIDIDYFKELEEKDGFIKILEPGDLDKLARNGLIIPLNDFIGQIPVIATMDDKVLSRFSDSDGNIWVFPDSNRMSMMHRVYNKKWLDESGFEVPKDIWSFLEFARYIANGDPNGNEIKDTFIQSYSNNGIAIDFGDIFNAFGCYFSSFNLPIAYNPVYGQYENVAENENFKNALGFILKLKNEGLIREDKNEYIMVAGEPTDKYLYASQRTSNNVPENFDEWEFGSCMSGDNKIALGLLTGTGSGFAVLKDTGSIADIMNSIIDVTDNVHGYCDFNYGREGYNYTIDGKRINYRFVYENSEVRMPIRFMTGYFNIHENGYYNVMQTREISDEYIIKNNKFYEDVKNYEADLIGTNLVYCIPYGADSSKILTLNLVLMEPFEKLFEDVFEENIDIDVAIDSFMMTCNKFDADSIIKTSNSDMND